MAHSDQVAGQGAGITVHAVVLVSAAVFAAALKLALQAHAGVAPLNAALGAGAIFLGLVVLHLVVRPRASRLVAPVKVRVKRSKLKVADKATVGTSQELAASPRGALASQRDASETPDSAQATPSSAQATPSSASATPSRASAMPSSYVPPPAMEPALVAPLHQSAMRERPALRGFEHLQTLVAELARQTPGPKAATPDPDAVQAATAVAWAEYVATRATQAAVADPASTLKSAAQAMAFAAPAPKISTPGLVAELSDALAADRLTIYLEPIQQIELQRPRHYEVSVRFKDATGVELPHDQVLAAARDAGLLPRVDAAVLPRAARIAQHFQLRGRDTEILAHVHGVSLPDQDFRAEVTAATIAADGAALVLSFAQSDLRGFGPIHWDILSTMADMGLRFAIESVTDLDMDFDALKSRGFEFVKLDTGVLLEGLPALDGIVASADVCRHFATAGLALIVNHVDDEQALARILGFGVLFGQGALFGNKRAVRSDLLSSPAAAA